MYSFEEKEKIIEKMKQGNNVEELYTEYGIDKTTLYKWEEEMLLRRRIKQLRQEGNLEEAKKETEKLNDKNSEIIKASILIGIARAEGDKETEEKMLNRQLELVPNDIISIIGLTVIAREKGDIRREGELLERQLKIRPTDDIAMKRLVVIARTEGDIEKERKFLTRLLKLNPDDEKAMKSLIRIEDKYAKFKKEKEKKEIAKMFSDVLETSKLQQARKVIYEESDAGRCAEKIKELLEGESGTDRELVLAELYLKSGLINRAQKSLKAYKNTLDQETQKMDIKFINKAIDLVLNPKTKRFGWKEFWIAKGEIEDMAKGIKQVQRDEEVR